MGTELSAVSGSLGYYSRTNNNVGVEMGAYDGAGIVEVVCKYMDGNKYFNYGDLSFPANPSSDSRGFFCTNRLSSTNTQGFINGVEIFNAVVSVVSLTNLNTYIGARNDSGITSSWSTKEGAFAFIGDGLTSGEMLDLYNLVQAFQAALGRDV
jgi:hypothetical protein